MYHSLSNLLLESFSFTCGYFILVWVIITLHISSKLDCYNLGYFYLDFEDISDFPFFNRYFQNLHFWLDVVKNFRFWLMNFFLKNISTKAQTSGITITIQ